MIKFKKCLTITIINIIYLGVLTFNQDPLKENYSMMTSSLFGYLKVMLLCVLLCISLYMAYEVINKKYVFLSLGPIIGCLFPYFDGKGDIISNLHVLFAYIGFGFVCIGTILNILEYKKTHYKQGLLLLKIFIVTFVFDCYLFTKLMGATSIQQFILFCCCLLINLYIVYNLDRGKTL